MKSLDSGGKEEIVRNFKKLWETEERYSYHVSKRIRDGHVSSEEEFIKRVFEVLADHTSVILYEAPRWKGCDFWHRIIYSGKYNWVVIVGEPGTVLTAFRVEEGKFAESLKGMEDAGYKAYRGKENRQIKEIAERVLLRLNG